MSESARESMEFDVVIVGAGPSGLATAIRLKQVALKNNTDISVCVLEKGAEVGAHILSGAVFDPIALNELLPEWRSMNAPIETTVQQDTFLLLGEEGKSRSVPEWLLPDCFHNKGNYIISLGKLVRWLGEQAEALGVDIYPGFAATEILYNTDGSVKGVATGEMGRAKDGSEKADYQQGMELHAKYTVFSEGARGQLGRQLIEKFQLDAGKSAQSYAIGIKELWEVPADIHQPGHVVHCAGWPLASDTYGGGFLYHLEDRKVAIGMVIGLDYQNPWLSPFDEFQRMKTHPAIQKHLKGGKRISYGARAITAGGLLSIPKLVFPGGLLVGCDAGFLNASRIKGSHAAIKSGMLAAESIALALTAGKAYTELADYPAAFENSWLYKELRKARNFKQWFKFGRTTGMLMTGIEQWLLKGNIPWTLRRKHPDHLALKPANTCPKIVYPKPDGVYSFDKLSSVFLSNTNHEEDEPTHLTLKDPSIPVQKNLAIYAGPEARYCPAGVYEFIQNEQGENRLQINAQNCVHCKTCDIKDPSQNIVWVAPQGGEGPVYTEM